MIRNSNTSWGSVSRAFHWSTVLLILIQIPLGFYMVEAYDVYKIDYADDTEFMRASLLHNTIGFIVLFVAVARLSWRSTQTNPELPNALVAYQRWLARLTHLVFYGLLLVYPLSGWATLSAYEFEFPIFFFGWDSVPGIVPSVKEGSAFDSDFFAEIHKACWKFGAVLLSLHVVAAIWHQYVRHDGLLNRMIKG